MKHIIKQRNLYLESVLHSIILLGFAFYFCIIVLSGTIYRFVHERHIPLLLASALLFFIIGILKLHQTVTLYKQSSNIRKRSKKQHIESCIYLSIFIVSLAIMTVSIGQEMKFSQFSYMDPVTEHHNKTSFMFTSDSKPLSLQEGVIVMNEENFSSWLTELYTNLDAWAGTKISISGFVWKDGELFAADEFALARMMMICCAADMQPVGILAQWNNTKNLAENEWITLYGTVEKKPYKDGFDPVIIIDTVEKTTRPQREYIYP